MIRRNRHFLTGDTRSHPLLLPLAALLVAAGCAGINVEPVDDQTDAAARGFRFYESAPFILVFTDNKGGLVSELHYLPDLTRKQHVKPYNYFASNHTTLTFSNGMLTQAKAEVDETAIPNAAIAGLQQVATGIVAAANANVADPALQVPAPYLFRVVKKNGKWQLAGDNSGRQPINLTAGTTPTTPAAQPADDGLRGAKQ